MTLATRAVLTIGLAGVAGIAVVGVYAESHRVPDQP